MSDYSNLSSEEEPDLQVAMIHSQVQEIAQLKQQLLQANFHSASSNQVSNLQQ